MKKIGILYICTGKYSLFWDYFYKSAEDNLFIDNTKYEKHYYIFTNNDNINKYNNKNIEIIPTKEHGYPLDTLYRYQIILQAEDKIKDMDYLYFFNANSIIINKIDKELIPTKKEIFTIMPNEKIKKGISYSTMIESDKDSTAYIDINDTRIRCYAIGTLFGGISSNIIELCKKLKENIDIDLNNHIVAKWHDESHLNKYLLDYNDYKILPETFLYFEDLDNMHLLKDSKIFIINKYNKNRHIFDNNKLPILNVKFNIL